MSMILPTGGAAYRAIPDELTMNTDRFLRILDRIRKREHDPHGDWCCVALAFTLTFLFPLVTTQTYKAAFNVKPEVWESLVLLGVVGSASAFLALLIRWGYTTRRFPARSSEQWLAEVTHQMDLELERAAVRARTLAEGGAGPTTSGAS